jgi:hypothetical protein
MDMTAKPGISVTLNNLKNTGLVALFSVEGEAARY